MRRSALHECDASSRKFEFERVMEVKVALGIFCRKRGSLLH